MTCPSSLATWHYSVQRRDRIFVKGYGFLSFAKMGKNISKNVSKNLSGKYSQKPFDHVKQSAAYMHLKLLQKESFKKQQKQLVI